MPVIVAIIVTMTLSLVATVAADNGGNRVRLQARMDGAQEVPGPGDADGRGRAKVVLNLATRQICWEVDFRNIGTPHAGHIHRGAAGVMGPVVFPFFDPSSAPASPQLMDQLERDRGEGCGNASEALIREIAGNPAGFYVNLHNSRFPAGAIRGQLSAGGDD